MHPGSIDHDQRQPLLHKVGELLRHVLAILQPLAQHVEPSAGGQILILRDIEDRHSAAQV